MKKKAIIKTIKITEPVWVIGDVHGEYDKLEKLISEIPEKDNICFVGDLIDRGRESKKVVKLVKDSNYDCVKGNHEEMALTDFKFWIREGGKITIKSYSNKLSENINYEEEYLSNPKFRDDLEWMEKLPIIIKYELEGEKPLYVSHSGIKLFETDEEIEDSNPEEFVLWNRRVQDEVDFAINIHGHSPRAIDDMFDSLSKINVDTGATGRDRPLTAVKFPSLEVIHSYD